MNFKSKQSTKYRESGNHLNLDANNHDNTVDHILANVKQREAEEQARRQEEARLANQAQNGGHKKRGLNGLGKIGLSQVSLPDNTGKWRPSNDNWRPGVNTDGFFTALAKLNEAKEERKKNGKVIYGEKVYRGGFGK